MVWIVVGLVMIVAAIGLACIDLDLGALFFTLIVGGTVLACFGAFQAHGREVRECHDRGGVMVADDHLTVIPTGKTIVIVRGDHCEVSGG